MKKTLSVLLTLVMILSVITLGGTTTFAQDSLVRVPSTIPGTDTPYNYVENVTVRIPGTEATFELSNVAETVQIFYDSVNETIFYHFDFYEVEKEVVFYQDGKFTLGCWWWISIEDNISAGESIPDDYHSYPTNYTFGTSFSGIDFEKNYTISVKPEILFPDECKEYSKAEVWFTFGDTEPHPTGKDTKDISEFVVSDNVTLNITEPSQTTINYKDGIVLNAETENIPNGAKVEWSADNDNFKLKKSDNGNTLTAISNKTGTTVFTATLYDSDNNVLTEDTVELNSKAGFAQKISGFFKVLFGLTKIYDK